MEREREREKEPLSIFTSRHNETPGKGREIYEVYNATRMSLLPREIAIREFSPLF